MSTFNTHVKWAERKDKLLITVEAKDATDVKVTFEDNKVMACGKGITKVGGEAVEFAVAIELLKTIDIAASTFHVTGAGVQILAIKTEAGAHWEKLTSEPSKKFKNYLSCDWALWKDEEDEEADEKMSFGGGGAGGPGGYGDMGNMMGGMGGPGGPGGAGGMDMASMMQNMGGAGGAGGMGGMDMAEMMKNMGGAGGAGGMGGMGGEEDSDDEEAPAADLEDLKA